MHLYLVFYSIFYVIVFSLFSLFFSWFHMRVFTYIQITWPATTVNRCIVHSLCWNNGNSATEDEGDMPQKSTHALIVQINRWNNSIHADNVSLLQPPNYNALIIPGTPFLECHAQPQRALGSRAATCTNAPLVLDPRRQEPIILQLFSQSPTRPKGASVRPT